MKKKAAAHATRKVPAKAAARVKVKRDGLAPLVDEVRSLIQSARRGAASVVNTLQVMTNFEIGRRIVEHEQKGAKRAEYGTELLKELSSRLTDEFGSGFSERNLRSFRLFYQSYQYLHRFGRHCLPNHRGLEFSRHRLVNWPPRELPRHRLGNRPSR